MLLLVLVAGGGAARGANEKDVIGAVHEFPGQSGNDLLNVAFALTHIYSEEQNRGFVRRAADSLPPGGLLLVFPSMVADDDETGPLSAAFLSLYFLCLATGEWNVSTGVFGPLAARPPGSMSRPARTQKLERIPRSLSLRKSCRLHHARP